ncbi:UvrD/REP helicase N-terminal domain-containing protein [Alkalibacterium thalassium]|uniref:DNA 3'-5' helicase n=2 Tax=Alkalibacterium thalassium TaxID=426701 RepID=A0A1G9GEW3_9LACT|nr:UvrD/REP helicase N-terminal domain-containing protein [Alkalibacterium thalassium]
MIISCHRLLINDPDKRNQLMNRYDYYLIDEFQDTNIIQAEIFYMLSSRTNNICVVGDDDQSIYGFRGADNLIFQNFQTTYTSSQVIYLNKNYRSLPFVIKGASQLISKNENRIQKEFLTHRFGKGKILISEEASLFNETNNVIKSIKELRDNGVPLNNIGVLYRVNRLASGLITLLEKEGIPYYTAKLPKDIHSGLVFGDIESYYRLSSGHGTKNDLLRIINRPSRYLKKDKLYNSGLGKKEILNALIKGEKEQYRIKGIIDKIDQLFKDLSKLKQLKPADFLDYLNFQMYYLEALDETSYFLNKEENTWRNEFFILREEAEMYESFEEWFVAIIRDKEKRKIEIADNKEKGVYLSTFHGAKGLQWEKVFIIAANERITQVSHPNQTLESLSA